MTRTSTVQMLRAAREGGYAVGAFNIVDDFSMRAVVDAAQERRSPVIIQVSVKTFRSIGGELLTSMFDESTKGVEVPVALHLDHCQDPEVIRAAVGLGWSSVLHDASHLDLDSASEVTAEMVHLAHSAGVEVESEIENIVGVEDGVGSDKLVHSYSVEELVEVADATGVDMMAPQLGTAHGEYHGTPHLLPERVREIAALTDRPLVLHGGTGLADEDFQSFIGAGISKINVSTAIKMSYMKSALVSLRAAEKANKWDPPTLFSDISLDVRATVASFFRIFGSEGRA